MLKKILAIILSTICLIWVAIPSVYAENDANIVFLDFETTSTTEYFEDGSYIVTTIKESPKGRSTAYTKVGEKIVNLYNSSDELQWTYTLIGTFDVVEGVSAVCTESTYTSTIYVKGWSLTAHNNYYSNNIAYGTATYKKKVLFITTSTQNIDGSIGCDIYGNVG